MFRIAHFVSDKLNREFVVVLMPGEDADEYARDSYRIKETLDIDGDAGSFPCSRELFSRI